MIYQKIINRKANQGSRDATLFLYQTDSSGIYNASGGPNDQAKSLEFMNGEVDRTRAVVKFHSCCLDRDNQLIFVFHFSSLRSIVALLGFLCCYPSVFTKLQIRLTMTNERMSL